MTAASAFGGSIRIAHVRTDWLPISENWLYWLVTRTPPDIEDYVLCERTLNRDQFSVERLHVIMASFGVRMLASMRGLRRAARCYLYARAARSFAPHLVHSHFGETGWQNLPLVRALGVPHIVSFYGVDLSRPDREESWSLRYRDMFDQDVTVLCQGPHMVERIVAHGARRDQVRIFRLGIDIEHLPYRPRNWSGAQPLRVLIAGRFVEKKGIPYAIGALARIASRVPLEVHLVGDANASNRSQAERARIAQAIERGGLTKCITRHGLIPYSALIELAYRCHVFLSPSVHAEDGDTEGGAPIALNEMAASGMPIVTTTHCDIPYALGGTQNALLAPERDADALADLLLKLLEHPDDWRPMLDRARAHVERDYDLVRQGEHLAQIYREVLGRSPKTIH